MTDIITAQKIVAIAKDDGIGGGKNIVAGASVNITFVGGGIAPIFSDNLGTTPISLPNVTDADGEFAFFIKSGEYFYVVAGESHRVTVGIGGLPITLSDSGNMTISNTGTVVIQSAATSIKNVLTIDAPSNTAIVDLKGGGSGSNANGFMRIYSGDGTLASYVGHQGGEDFNAQCVEGFSILSSQKTGAQGLVAAGNQGAIVTPNGGGTKAVISLSQSADATDKATFEYDFTSTPVVSLKRLGTAYLTVSSDSLTQWTGAGTIAAQYTPTNTTIFRNGQPRLAASATETILYSPSTIPVVTATTTTTTINAGNGTQAIAISSSGGVVAQDYFGQKYSREHQWNWVHDGTLYSAVDIIIDSSNGWGELEISLSGDYSSANNNGAIYKVQQVGFSGSNDYRGGSHVREYNANGLIAERYHVSDLYYSATRSQWVVTVTALYAFGDNPVIIRAKLTLQANITNQTLRGLTLSSTYTGTVKTAHPTGLSVPSLQADSATIGGNATAANFYGNGYNITQLSASNVVNGTLPSNIFPATISAASITFSGNHIAKGGTAYNLLDITSSASILRDSAGYDVFNASTTALSLKRASNIVLSASSTATQLFNHSAAIRANFDASNTQIFSPATVPFISATTSTAAITSGNGASCIEIDSTGAATMVHREFLVSTKPSAAANARRAIIITDATLGYGLYISDGTNWRSSATGTIQA